MCTWCADASRALLIAVLCACGGSAPGVPQSLPARAHAPGAAAPPEATPGVSRAPSAAEAVLIRQLSSETERLRALKFRAPVRVRIQDRVAMRAYVETALDAVELAKARRRYVALGLLDPSLDVAELIAALMEEELVGYYDPEQKLLAIRDDVAGALSQPQPAAEGDLEWRATVVHELVHALQDQHLGLSDAMEQKRTTDQENVFGAVVEGDATLAMLGYAAERQGSSLETLVADPLGLRRSLYDNPLQTGGRLAAAPAIVREPLLFRYREGAMFAARTFARSGWEGVNAAHRRQPSSTLALSAAHANFRDPLPASFPELGSIVAPSCEEADRDVLGSLEIGAALSALGLTSDDVAQAWRGDNYAVLACGGSDASLWWLRFSTVSLARRVRTALLRPDASGAKLRVITQQGGALMVARGLTPQLLPALTPLLQAWANAAH